MGVVFFLSHSRSGVVCGAIYSVHVDDTLLHIPAGQIIPSAVHIIYTFCPPTRIYHKNVWLPLLFNEIKLLVNV